MITAKKVLAAIMAATLLVSTLMFTGCNKKKGNEEKISEDEVWYSVKKTEVGKQFQLDKNVDSSSILFVGETEGKVVYYAQIIKLAPEGMYPSSTDDDLMLSYFEIYGQDGSLERTIDIRQKITDSGMFKLDPDDYPNIIERLRKDETTKDKTDKQIFEESNISVSWFVNDNFNVKNGFVSLTLNACYPSNDLNMIDVRSVEVVFDIGTGEISHYNKQKERSEILTDVRYEFEGYEIAYTSRNEAGKGSRCFSITTPDGRAITYRGDEVLGNDDNDAAATSLIYLGEGKALFTTGDYVLKYYEINLETGQVTQAANDYSWIADDLYNATYVKGTGYVICDMEGLKKIDFKNKKKEEIFSFDCCNINRSEAFNMKFLAMTDNAIYLSGLTSVPLQTLYSPSLESQNLYILTKERVNPHAGKTVLHATMLTFYDYPICEAVSIFNDSNNGYFIKLDNNYSPLQKVFSGELSFLDDDYSEQYDKLSAEMSYQLAIDLMNGEGPDIILDAADITHLNNGNYLMDLKKEIKTDGLFENIIKASESDGKLYQFPLSVSITGIAVSKKDVAADQYGFSFDQYKELVSGPCNGKDPISLYAEQTDYFRRCLITVKDSYYKDGKVNFDTPEFRALAEYTQENVSVKKQPGADEFFLKTIQNSRRKVMYEVGISMPQLVRYLPDSISDIKILGLPSYDGRGPSMTVMTSMGISATTNEKKACVDFLKLLLSEELQECIGLYQESTPVRKTAYEATALQAIEKNNSVYDRYKDVYLKDTLVDLGIPFCKIDNKVVKDYEEMLNSCSVISEADPAITIIVTEEMPAYFTGQKSLDDVIKIINDRAQTYVNEREGK